MKKNSIQFMRAFAVLSVVFYHANSLRGGFIGVDIFLVISGYVITSSILRYPQEPILQGLRRFYVKRFRRIFPSSTATIIAVILMAFLIFPTFLRISIFSSAIFSLLSLQNFYLALTGAQYGALDSHNLPLLHFWSLSLEEQFYFLWPILVLTLRNYRRKILPFVSLAITCVSLLVCFLLSGNHPLLNFYGIPSRIWELLAGSLVSIFELQYLATVSFLKKVLNFLCVTGLIISCWIVSDSSTWPNFSTLIVVILSCFLILFERSWPKFLMKFAELRVFQWIGEISFSIYLTHWPVLLALNEVFPELGFFQRLGLTLFITGIAASALFMLIERPFRYSLPSKFSVAVTAVVIFATLAFSFEVSKVQPGIAVKVGNGITERIKFSDFQHKFSSARSGYCEGVYVSNFFASENCKIQKRNVKRVVLLGDSHAEQWISGLKPLLSDRNVQFLNLTKAGCTGFLENQPQSTKMARSECEKWRLRNLVLISRFNPDLIVMSALMGTPSPTRGISSYSYHLNSLNTFASNLSSRHTKILYIQDTPYPSYNIPICISGRRVSKCSEFHLWKSLKPSKHEHLFLIDPTSQLCTTTCHYYAHGVVAYRDGSHISDAEAAKLSQWLISSVDKLLYS